MTSREPNNTTHPKNIAELQQFGEVRPATKSKGSLTFSTCTDLMPFHDQFKQKTRYSKGFTYFCLPLYINLFRAFPPPINDVSNSYRRFKYFTVIENAQITNALI